MLHLEIFGKEDNLKFQESGKEITALYNAPYEEGDYIKITLENCLFVSVKLEESLKESIVYVPNGIIKYTIPFGDKRVAYASDAWTKEKNIISVKEALEEAYSYRNIALNSAALRYTEDYFPYAKANYVTRDEVCFEERNSIDGVIEQDCHGSYPYQSYAGGAREDIEYFLYFGKEVEIDKIIFYLRADFKDEHDTYWKSLSVEFDDGSKMPLEFIKSNKGQEVKLGQKKKTTYIHLTDFKQAAFPLSWAALTQIEVFGNYIK